MNEAIRISRRGFTLGAALLLCPKRLLAEPTVASKKLPRKAPKIQTLLGREISHLRLTGSGKWGERRGGVSWTMLENGFEPVSGSLYLSPPRGRIQEFPLPKSPVNGKLLRGLCFLTGIREMPANSRDRRSRAVLAVYSGEQGVNPRLTRHEDTLAEIRDQGLTVASESINGEGVIGKWRAWFVLTDVHGEQHASPKVSFDVRL